MNLSISNLAWPSELDEAALAILPDAGFAGVEIAPTKLWPAPTEVSSSALGEYRRKVGGLGLRISALQSLLFGKPDLQIFVGDDVRRSTLEYLKRIIAVAAALGAESLVFGSPRNRRRGELSREAADDIAFAFFLALGAEAAAQGVRIGIEANPVEYQADFLTSAEEAIAFVRRLDHPGVRLHLCAGCMRLAGDDTDAAVANGHDLLTHVHASEPMLAPLRNGDSDHVRFATALRNVGYSRWISIERSTPQPFRWEDLIEDMRFVRAMYQADPP